MNERMTPDEQAEFEKHFNGEKLVAVDEKQLLEMKIPPREHILESIIQTQSTNMMLSKRGVGKAYVSLGMGAAVAAGATFLRWHAPKARRVLYIDGEMPAITMQERFAAIIAGMDTEIES